MKGVVNHTPSWLGPLMGALVTVGSTWLTIQTQVSDVVTNAVELAMVDQRERMESTVDSLFAGFRVDVDTLIAQRIRTSTDSITSRIGLIPTQQPDGTRIYRPNIVVPADTATLRRILERLDSLTTYVDTTRAEKPRPRGYTVPNTQNRTWKLRKR